MKLNKHKEFKGVVRIVKPRYFLSCIAGNFVHRLLQKYRILRQQYGGVTLILLRNQSRINQVFQASPVFQTAAISNYKFVAKYDPHFFFTLSFRTPPSARDVQNSLSLTNNSWFQKVMPSQIRKSNLFYNSAFDLFHDPLSLSPRQGNKITPSDFSVTVPEYHHRQLLVSLTRLFGDSMLFQPQFVTLQKRFVAEKKFLQRRENVLRLSGKTWSTYPPTLQAHLTTHLKKTKTSEILEELTLTCKIDRILHDDKMFSNVKTQQHAPSHYSPPEMKLADSKPMIIQSQSHDEHWDASGSPSTISTPQQIMAEPPKLDISDLTNRVYDEFERKLRMEKERRGL